MHVYMTALIQLTIALQMITSIELTQNRGWEERGEDYIADPDPDLSC